MTVDNDNKWWWKFEILPFPRSDFSWQVVPSHYTPAFVACKSSSKPPNAKPSEKYTFPILIVLNLLFWQFWLTRNLQSGKIWLEEMLNMIPSRKKFLLRLLVVLFFNHMHLYAYKRGGGGKICIMNLITIDYCIPIYFICCWHQGKVNDNNGPAVS